MNTCVVLQLSYSTPFISIWFLSGFQYRSKIIKRPLQNKNNKPNDCQTVLIIVFANLSRVAQGTYEPASAAAASKRDLLKAVSP